MHKIFAENLRRECSRYNSIASVCTGIGINRQQFNKYLAGGSIPSALTLRKICHFLEISEQSLFVGGATERPARSMLQHDLEVGRGPLAALARGFRNFDSQVNDVPSGMYFCYFPLPNVPGMFLRSLVVVNRMSRGTTFVRLTNLPFSKNTNLSLAKGRHSGVVFANETEIYFAGVNRYPSGQFSLMTVERTNGTGQHFFTGMAMTRSGTGLTAMRMCLLRVETTVNIREAIKKLGYVHEADVTFDALAVSALRSSVQ